MHKFIPGLLLAVGSAQAASVPKAQGVSPAHKTNASQPTFFEGTCNANTLQVRKEWRNMSTAEKKAYLEAELCLFALPAQTTLSGVSSRFSDMQAVHRTLQNVTMDDQFVGDVIHNVGQFLPWHRYYMATHETLLRTECGYTGPMSWWDEEADANSGDVFRSEMWSSESFGGNGTGADNCLMDGAFANITMHIGPGLENTDYCLDRVQTSDYVEWMVTENIETCSVHNDYFNYFNCMVEFTTGPHVAGHNSSGGIMADIYASSGDPMFYMHHNYVDRMWWKWQTANASSRMMDMSGNTLNETFLEVNGVTLPSSVARNTTLNYTLTVEDILPDIQIWEVMNAQGGYLCYEYDY
ncbi:unnamed protein product [Discula destructiva]